MAFMVSLPTMEKNPFLKSKPSAFKQSNMGSAETLYHGTWEWKIRQLDSGGKTLPALFSFLYHLKSCTSFLTQWLVVY